MSIIQSVFITPKNGRALCSTQCVNYHRSLKFQRLKLVSLFPFPLNPDVVVVVYPPYLRHGVNRHSREEETTEDLRSSLREGAKRRPGGAACKGDREKGAKKRKRERESGVERIVKGRAGLGRSHSPEEL